MLHFGSGWRAAIPTTSQINTLCPAPQQWRKKVLHGQCQPLQMIWSALPLLPLIFFLSFLPSSSLIFFLPLFFLFLLKLFSSFFLFLSPPFSFSTPPPSLQPLFFIHYLGFSDCNSNIRLVYLVWGLKYR